TRFSRDWSSDVCSSDLFIDLPVHNAGWLLVFSVLSCGVMGNLGIIAGLWSEKFDQLAAFQNFLILPATFLSGVFYSIHSLPAFWQDRKSTRLNSSHVKISY